jgi:hypothetical protein
MISGFCSIVNEIFTLLACNAEMIGRYQHFSDCLTLEDGTLVVPKHGYTNYYCIGIFIISHYNEPQTTEQPTHTHIPLPLNSTTTQPFRVEKPQ